MQRAGLEVEWLDYDPSTVPLLEEFAHDSVRDLSRQTCLIGRRHGTAKGRSLILFAHPDTEPVERAVDWESDPFDPVMQDGRLIGWGIADSLAGIAMLTGAMAEIERLAGDVIFISAPSKRHRRGIAAALHHGVSADAAVYLHPAESGRGLNDIKAFAPGQLEFSVTVTGLAPETEEPAHTAFAHKAISPFAKLWPIVHALQKLGDERAANIEHPVLQREIGCSTNLMITQCQFGYHNRPLSIASNCEIRVAVSLIPGEALQDVQHAIEGRVAQASMRDAWLADNPPKITWLAGVAAVSTPQASSIYQAVSAVLSDQGANPVINPLHTSSDIRNPLVQKAIPTVGFGPSCGNLAANGHRHEWVDSADLERATAATANLICQWCGKG